MHPKNWLCTGCHTLAEFTHVERISDTGYQFASFVFAFFKVGSDRFTYFWGEVIY